MQLPCLLIQTFNYSRSFVFQNLCEALQLCQQAVHSLSGGPVQHWLKAPLSRRCARCSCGRRCPPGLNWRDKVVAVGDGSMCRDPLPCALPRRRSRRANLEPGSRSPDSSIAGPRMVHRQVPVRRFAGVRHEDTGHQNGLAWGRDSRPSHPWDARTSPTRTWSFRDRLEASGCFAAHHLNSWCQIVCETPFCKSPTHKLLQSEFSHQGR